MQKIRIHTYGKTSRYANHGSAWDATEKLVEAAKIAKIKIWTGNDAPRGGKNGNYVDVYEKDWQELIGFLTKGGKKPEKNQVHKIRELLGLY